MFKTNSSKKTIKRNFYLNDLLSVLYTIHLFFSRVFAAFFAAFERSDAVRFLAADFACFESALCETVLVGSFFKAFILALDLFCDTGLCDFAFSSSCFAFFFKCSTAFFGGGTFTPARRASDKSYGYCLLCRTYTMFSFFYFFYFIMYKFTCLCACLIYLLLYLFLLFQLCFYLA